MGERIVTLRLSDEDGLLLERTARECGILAKNTLGMPEPAGSMAGLVKALIRAERHRGGTIRDVLVATKVVAVRRSGWNRGTGWCGIRRARRR